MNIQFEYFEGGTRPTSASSPEKLSDAQYYQQLRFKQSVNWASTY